MQFFDGARLVAPPPPLLCLATAPHTLLEPPGADWGRRAGEGELVNDTGDGRPQGWRSGEATCVFGEISCAAWHIDSGE